MMKLAKILGIVIGLHAGLAMLLFVQPGCQPTQVPQASDTLTGPVGGMEDSPQSAVANADAGQLDPAFNAGLPTTSSSGGGFAAPTRPAGGVDRTTGGGSGVLQPLGTSQVSAPTVSTSTYTVQRGDSLWAIAQRHRISLAELLELNNIDAKQPLSIGQSITVPGGATSRGGGAPSSTGSSASNINLDPSADGPDIYRVQRGDTLSTIATRFGTTVVRLRELNGLSNDRIFAGQPLRVPRSGGRAAPVTPPPSGVAGGVSYSATGTDPFEGRLHVVAKGETPGEIAAMYGMTWQELLRLNGISDPRSLKVGQVLRLESGGGAVAAPATTTPAPATRQPSQQTPVRTPAPPPPPAQRIEPEDELDAPLVPIEEASGS